MISCGTTEVVFLAVGSTWSQHRAIRFQLIYEDDVWLCRVLTGLHVSALLFLTSRGWQQPAPSAALQTGCMSEDHHTVCYSMLMLLPAAGQAGLLWPCPPWGQWESAASLTLTWYSQKLPSHTACSHLCYSLPFSPDNNLYFSLWWQNNVHLKVQCGGFKGLC